MARNPDLDMEAATTRSLLGWGVVAGPFYVVVGLVLALTRPGFDLTRDALSLLTLGDLGWLQRANLMVSGVMAIVAAIGVLRAIRNGRGLAIGALVAAYGACLVLSGVFTPDATTAFPPGSHATGFTLSGTLHLLFGAIGFVAMTAAAFAFAGWVRTVGGRAWPSIVLGIVILVGFVGGAALSQNSAGVALLWLAVLAVWGWLALACVTIYRWSPHPLRSARE